MSDAGAASQAEPARVRAALRRATRATRLYEGFLVLPAVACLVLGGISWWHTGQFHPLADALAIVAVVATGFAPLTVADAPHTNAAYLDAAVLIALAVLLPPGEVVVVYALAQACSHLTLWRRGGSRFLINMSATTIGSTAAVAVLAAGPSQRGAAVEIGLVFLAACVYSVSTVLLFWPADKIARRFSFRVYFLEENLRLMLIEAFVIDSVGYIAAVLARWTPWGLALVAGPVALLSLTSRGLNQVHSDRVRMRELVLAGDAMGSAVDRAAVLDVLLDHAPRMLACDAVELRDEPPRDEEIGAQLVIAGTPEWIVAPRGLRKERFNAQDSQSLHALVRLVQSTVAGIDLLEGVSYRAFHDPLTGLPNRALLDETLAAESRRAIRTGSQFAVIYLDLDGFKPVNDEHGHDAGDAVLVETAQRIRDVARASDTVARLGGDEFCVLAPDIGSPESAVLFAEKICTALASPHELPRGSAVVSASAGVAMGPHGADDVDQLMRRADQAMYAAKQAQAGPVLAP